MGGLEAAHETIIAAAKTEAPRSMSRAPEFFSMSAPAKEFARLENTLPLECAYHAPRRPDCNLALQLK